MDQFWIETIWLIPCYPLIGAAGSLYWSPGFTRRTGPRPSAYVNGILTVLAFLHSIFALITIWNQPAQEILLPWLQVAGLDLTLPLQASTVTLGACAVVTGINFLSQLFAIGYMEMDWGWARFFSLLGLFEAGMCALALTNSLFFSYVVLEILTLGTYLLIGLWFNQSLVVTGARDAFLTKRVGDLFLLIGVVALYPLAGTWDYSELAIWAQTVEIDPGVITLVGLALLAGPMGKCAQFPLHLWLDEAMEGPIPASILRNSVVVATGAWVLIKLEPVLALSPFVMKTAVVIGTISAVGGTLVAIAQIDVKRALSYLVTAYMGLTFIAVGTDQSDAAFLLLFTFAPGMALMVMAVGCVIWNSITQDLRLLGGLWSRRPISGIAFLVGAFSLAALPPLGNFWPVMQMINRLWSTQPGLAITVLIVNGIAACGTVRVFGLIWGGKPKQMTERSPEVHWPMVFPMVVAMGFALHVPHLLITWNLLPSVSTLFEIPSLMLMASTGIGAGIGAAIYLNPKWPKPLEYQSIADLQDLLANDFYTPRLYRSSVVFIVAVVSQITNLLDRYVVDGFVNLVGLTSTASGQVLKYTISGKSQLYLLSVVLGIALVILVVFWSFGGTQIYAP